MNESSSLLPLGDNDYNLKKMIDYGMQHKFMAVMFCHHILGRFLGLAFAQVRASWMLNLSRSKECSSYYEGAFVRWQ